jgi:hypothetical protein
MFTEASIKNTEQEFKFNFIQKALEQQIGKELVKADDVNIVIEDSSASYHSGENQLVPFNKELIKPPSDLSDGEETDREWEQREKLPVDRDPNNKPSIWKVLKDLIGKDLSRFAIPVYFNEPISMMQKVAEIMEYTDLLKKADESDDPQMRMLYVIAFSIS